MDRPLPPPPLRTKPKGIFLSPPPVPQHKHEHQVANGSVSAAVKLFGKASPHLTTGNATKAYKVAKPHMTIQNMLTAHQVYSTVQKHNKTPPPLPQKTTKPPLSGKPGSPEPTVNHIPASLKERFESPAAQRNEIGTASESSSVSVRNLKSQLESKLHFGGDPRLNATIAVPMRPKSTVVSKEYMHNRTSVPPNRPPPPNKSMTTNKDEPYAVCLHNFQGQCSDELNVIQGDYLIIDRHVDIDWIYACNCRTNKHGIVPKSFIRIERDVCPSTGTLPSSMGTLPPSIGTLPHHLVSSPTSSCDDDSGIGPTIQDGPRCYSLYEFQSSQPTDLCFNSGEMIKLTKRLNVEWFCGETSDGRSGCFPTNFVEIIQDLPLDDSNTLCNLQATAIFDYCTNHTSDLSFTTGSIIKLLSRLNDDWIRGETCDGRQGIFPSNFVDHVPLDLPLETVDTDANSSCVGKIVVAQFDYSSAESGDLVLFVGDRVKVTGQVSDDWLMGEKVGGHRLPEGIFPLSYVQFET